MKRLGTSLFDTDARTSAAHNHEVIASIPNRFFVSMMSVTMQSKREPALQQALLYQCRVGHQLVLTKLSLNAHYRDDVVMKQSYLDPGAVSTAFRDFLKSIVQLACAYISTIVRLFDEHCRIERHESKF
ncbi:hypothetical protein WJ15_27890 [Burkholderia cepacia]|nr:hypothetical protein WJ15_27890 [Burkholderia cepacia]